MRAYFMDEDQLGHMVDTWLASLRVGGLSDRRLGELARQLGQAMSDRGPQQVAEARVLQEFETWWHDHANGAHIPQSEPR